MRCLEASRSQLVEAAAAASTPAAPASAVIGLNPIIVSDTKEAATKETKPQPVVSPVSTVKKANAQSRSASRSRSKSRGSADR